MSAGLLSRFDRHTYEDPFLDMASTRLPKSFRKLQELCQIFAMTHPQIAPIVWRLAEYPITSIVYTGDEEARRQNKSVMEGELGILDRCIEWGLDYHAQGNCLVTVQFPFLRFYRCLSCNELIPAKRMENRRFDGREFTGSCKKCRGIQKFEPVDQYIRRAKGIRVVRLDPMLVTIKYNELTGEHFYFYDIPIRTKAAINRSDWDIIDSTPVAFIKCILKNTKMRLSRVFHFKRPTLSGRDMQWGLPLIMPALKDAYLNQIYKKADEQIALEHSVPLRILFPEPGTQDPLAKIALGSFKSFMEQNIRYWRKDKNAILTAPLPVGVKVIGGDQSAYQTIQARQFVVDEIIGAMMVTKGFIMGNEQWSAASISQRILENSFLNYLRRLDACLQWVAEEVQSYLRIPKCGVSMKPFKKVDDIQQLQLIIQLAREKKVSWNETLSRLDLDSNEQLRQIEKEAGGYLQVMIQELIGQAEAGAKGAVINTAAQIEAEGVQATLQQHLESKTRPPSRQLGTGEPKAKVTRVGEPEVGEDAGASAGRSDGTKDVPIRMDDQIEQWAQDLLRMDPGEQRALLSRMARESPKLGKAVAERASELQRESQSTEQMLQQAKNPDELAQRLSLLEPRAKLRALRAIQQRNPPLGLMVMKALARLNMNAAGVGPGEATVDMRPLPEQKPPTREAKPV